jgi:carbamoylphosphate synthase small subunit
MMNSLTVSLNYQKHSYMSQNKDELVTLIDTGSCKNIISQYTAEGMRLNILQSKLKIVNVSRTAMDNSGYVVVYMVDDIL